MKKLLALSLAAILIVSLVACGEKMKKNGDSDSDGEKMMAPVDLVMGTGSSGGTYFALGGAMANAINDKLVEQKITVTAQSSGASVDNINLINAGEMDLGIATNNVAANAYDGVGAFSSPTTKVSAIAITRFIRL